MILGCGISISSPITLILGCQLFAVIWQLYTGILPSCRACAMNEGIIPVYSCQITVNNWQPSIVLISLSRKPWLFYLKFWFKCAFYQLIKLFESRQSTLIYLGPVRISILHPLINMNWKKPQNMPWSMIILWWYPKCIKTDQCYLICFGVLENVLQSFLLKTVNTIFMVTSTENVY